MTEKMLAGRTALVTGSGQNIGRATLLAFAAAGANVVVNGLKNRDSIEKVAEEARALGVEALPLLADVGDSDQVEAMVQQAVDRFGSLDIVVSNVSLRLHQPFLEITPKGWRQVIENNLSSAFYLAHAAIPHMKKRNWGRIIHISGRDGFSPKTNRAHNVTAKAGTFALAKAIAIEFGEFGITANAVAPGIIETTRDPVHYPNFEVEYEKRRKALPLRRLGRVEDIADTCLFLTSQSGGFITGQIIHANGGEFMF
ncbi:SDR family oxidoreductase [Bosea sp. BK604]|uniref:SDR family NAD(P)-dependent oxidoreductase n=1 Tax=Bosea sp. BK604 TaxID=2512180 RepID=UPI001043E9F0|nr:SDR family oxidoreductase [Bosea sp. BK604]TCR62550.1 3-oxoacyl-[acyl-carrier protein] reductase [Bosea sp. BK604]